MEGNNVPYWRRKHHVSATNSTLGKNFHHQMMMVFDYGLFINSIHTLYNVVNGDNGMTL